MSGAWAVIQPGWHGPTAVLGSGLITRILLTGCWMGGDVTAVMVFGGPNEGSCFPAAGGAAIVGRTPLGPADRLLKELVLLGTRTSPLNGPWGWGCLAGGAPSGPGGPAQWWSYRSRLRLALDGVIKPWGRSGKSGPMFPTAPGERDIMWTWWEVGLAWRGWE